MCHKCEKTSTLKQIITKYCIVHVVHACKKVSICETTLHYNSDYMTQVAAQSFISRCSGGQLTAAHYQGEKVKKRPDVDVLFLVLLCQQMCDVDAGEEPAVTHAW